MYLQCRYIHCCPSCSGRRPDYDLGCTESLSDEQSWCQCVPSWLDGGGCYCFDVILLHDAGLATRLQICILTRSVLHTQQSLTPFSSGHRLYLMLDKHHKHLFCNSLGIVHGLVWDADNIITFSKNITVSEYSDYSSLKVSFGKVRVSLFNCKQHVEYLNHVVPRM